MAEQTKFTFNEEIIKAKIASLTKSRDDQAGKAGVNPFIWYRDNVASKVAAYEKGDRSKEVYDAIMSVKELAPVK